MRGGAERLFHCHDTQASSLRMSGDCGMSCARRMALCGCRLFGRRSNGCIACRATQRPGVSRLARNVLHGR